MHAPPSSEVESVILVRHARSLANDDPTVYFRHPDHTIPLCAPTDDPDAIRAGQHVASLALDPASLCAWSSTYLRCLQTQSLVMGRAFGGGTDAIRHRESFLLREQDYGDWDGLSEDEIARRDPMRWEKRKRLIEEFGRFYFRFPNGESRADVVQRIAIFIGKLQRASFRHHILFVHGVVQRAFRMAWFDRSVEWFEREANPPNASVTVIERDPTTRRWIERPLGETASTVR